MFTLDFPVAHTLPEWTALELTGADAGSFLHGQFTNDVAALQIGSTQYNGYCSAKGRMLATFALLRSAEQTYLLAVPTELAEGLERRLRMFMLRARVTIRSLAATHACIGIAGVSGSALTLDEDVHLLLLADGRQLVVCPRAGADSMIRTIVATANRASTAAWDRLAIDAGIAVITTATQDKFVPQMLNWELVGGVSFQKGCYPGQEIVARMQYLGKLKERLFRARVRLDSPPAPGTPLFGTEFGEQSCGTVVNAARVAEDSVELLAVLQVSSAASDRIRVGAAADSPVLELLALPYPVPPSSKK
ncbi:MAG: folate-binding protein [Betaproteobacteria bacterium]